MESILICDLSHTSQRISSEYMPYAIACIQSYYHEYGQSEADICLVKFPENLSPEFLARKPAIVAFSNYMWNTDLNYSFAKAIKSSFPETLIVFGSRNYPLETPRQEKWFQERPAVDFYVIGEGEEPFQKLADLWLESRSCDKIREAEINGVHSYKDGKLIKSGAIRKDGYDQEPRINDLTVTPSPYLEGYLDAFLEDPRLSPLMETNRGCPFECTFCVDGVGSRQRIYKSSLERAEKELVYIAERCKGKYLQLADVNFGMYPEDTEFSKLLARIKNEYNFPHHIQVCAGKNNQERIIECGDILEGSLRFGASIQSMDDEVLSNIKRSNISYQKLIEVAKRVSNTEASTYSEVILALPGDSKKKHINTMDKIVEAGMNQVRPLTLLILEGSELATDEHRKKFKIKTRYRATHRSFGKYIFNGKEFSSVEIEEVCVENDTLSFEDYVECRRYAFTISNFYNDKVFFELVQFIKNMGLNVTDWLKSLHTSYEQFPEKLKNIYDQFTRETREELAESKEELEWSIKKSPDYMESYIRGDRGNNVLFNNQARAHLQAMEELHQVAFQVAKDITKVEHGSLMEHYLEELERYSLNKKKSFNDVEKEILETFDFDFVGMESEFFETLPVKRSPVKIKFSYEDNQKEFFVDNVQRQGESLQAMGKIFSRINIKKLQRKVYSESEM